MVSCTSLLFDVWFTRPSSSSTTRLLLLSLHTTSKCPDPLDFLQCFPLAGQRRSYIHNKKHFTFLAIASPSYFVFPLTLFTSLRTSPLPPSNERVCFSDATIERTISLNCGSVKFRLFRGNFRRSSCDKHLLITWSRICSWQLQFQLQLQLQVWVFVSV